MTGVALAAAYAHCQQLARAHYENFPVASRLLPAALRPHVAAVYAFARTADDFADEPGMADDERLRLLAEWQARLHDAATSADDDRNAAMIFAALHDTITRFALPIELFDDLLSAFRQDVVTTRYATWAQVLDYCRRSANPVGRLVLRLNGYQRDDLDAASDAVCTGLQLTNFWQDVAVDWPRGRLYVPEECWAAHGATLTDLERGRISPAWRLALADCTERTRGLFDNGRAVCDGVQGRLRYELRATWHGGQRILERLAQVQFDVFAARPKLAAVDAAVIGWRTLAWSSAPAAPIPGSS